MAAKTGADTAIGYRLNSTGAFDSHTQAGASDLLIVNDFSHSKNQSELRIPGIGSGLVMDSESFPGQINPGGSLTKPARYDDAGMFMLAQIFGTDTVMGMGSSSYLHSIVMNETHFGYFATMGMQNDTSNAMDYENVYPSKVTFTGSPNAALMQAVEWLATNRRISGAQNSVSSLDSATLPTSTVAVIVRPDDYFYINDASGGALSSSDKVNITQITIEFLREIENVPEIRGAEGLGQQRSSGDAPLQANVIINLKNQQNNTWYTALDAETEYKASFRATGAVIGGSNSEFFEFNFPRLKIVTDPEYNLSSTAENPTTIRFKALYASAAPTGMIKQYPYIRLQNRRSTSYLA